MKIQRHKDAEWSHFFHAMTNEFEKRSFPGQSGLRFLENVSIEDYYAIDIFLKEQQLHVWVCRWYKMKDAQRWHQLDPSQWREVFEPALVIAETTLSNEERDYFPQFLQQLLIVPEGEVIEPVTGDVLDGSEYVVKIFDNGKEQRSFRWNSTKRTRGLMEQLMKLAGRAMKNLNS